MFRVLTKQNSLGDNKVDVLSEGAAVVSSGNTNIKVISYKQTHKYPLLM